MREALQKVDEAISALVKAGVLRSSHEVVSLEIVRRDLMEQLYGFVRRDAA